MRPHRLRRRKTGAGRWRCKTGRCVRELRHRPHQASVGSAPFLCHTLARRTQAASVGHRRAVCQTATPRRCLRTRSGIGALVCRRGTDDDAAGVGAGDGTDGTTAPLAPSPTAPTQSAMLAMHNRSKGADDNAANNGRGDGGDATTMQQRCSSRLCPPNAHSHCGHATWLSRWMSVVRYP